MSPTEFRQLLVWLLIPASVAALVLLLIVGALWWGVSR